MARFIAFLLFAASSIAASSDDAPRVASLNPGLTEIMVALELSESLVAVSDYCAIPDSLPLSRIGTELTPNTEALLTSRPSHVLTGKSISQKRLHLLPNTVELGLPITTANEVRAAIQVLGQTFEREPQAVRLIGQLDAALHKKTEKYSRVLVIAGVSQHKTAQLYLMNPKSLHGDLLEAAGFGLLSSPNHSRVWVIGPEKLIRLNPNLIIVLDPSAEDPVTQAKYKDALAPWHQVKDKGSDDVIFLTDPVLSSMGIGALELGNAAHHALSSTKTKIDAH